MTVAINQPRFTPCTSWTDAHGCKHYNLQQVNTTAADLTGDVELAKRAYKAQLEARLKERFGK